MEGKQSFVLYKSFYKPTKALSLEQKGMLYDAIFNYQIEGIEPEPDSEIIMAFMFFQNQFELDNVKYFETIERNTKNGKKGGRPKKSNQNPTKPKKPTGLNGNPTKPKKADNGNEKDNDTEKGNEKETVKGKEEKEKTASENSLFQILVADWSKRYLEETELKYQWNKAEGATLNQLITKLRNLAKQQHEKDNNTAPVTDDEIVKFWDHLLNKLPTWYAEKGDLKIINSKFNEIVREIKSPYSKGKKLVADTYKAFGIDV